MILSLKNTSRQKLIIIISLITIVIIIFVFEKIKSSNSLILSVNTTVVSALEQTKTPDASKTSLLPVNIKIPSIKVNAAIESMGITKDGSMDAPKGPSNTGWFSLGVRPGDIGSSVIDGHSGWKNNTPAVFDNLYKVKIGDKVNIEDEKGMTITFVVREIRRYDPKADSSEIFISNDGKAHLNLITCTGFWNTILKSHSQRLVVFTDRENLELK